MTDLEITWLCAEAMGMGHSMSESETGFPLRYWPDGADGLMDYDPLHNDAQTMALEDWLIELGYLLYFNGAMNFALNKDVSEKWEWIIVDSKEKRRRAICECVAKLQAQK